VARAVSQLKRRREAWERIDQIMREPSMVNVVHYSCESFYGPGRADSPRVTSIAVRNLGSRQNRSYSISLIAEREQVKKADIPTEYNRLERIMLEEFFELVAQQAGHFWVNWNMRDSIYGFPALEHRCRVLGGSYHRLANSQQVDLAALAPALYGVDYVPVPRLENIVDLNNITKRDFLSGSEEPSAFAAGEFVKLHLSTLRKVDIISDILNRMWDRTLKTNATWRAKYGPSIVGFVEATTDHWVFKVLGALGILVSLLTGAIAVFG
jgi:hypothetical protein